MAIDFGNLLGGLLGAAGNVYAANRAADSAQQTGQAALAQAQFRPVGVTTRFGRSGFQYSPEGRVIGAGYEVAPDIAAMRESLLGISGGALQQAQRQQGMQGLFQTQANSLQNLAGSFLPSSYTYAPSVQAMGLSDMLRSQAAASAPVSYAAAPNAAAQQYAQQIQGVAGSALPSTLNVTAPAEAQQLQQSLGSMASAAAPTSFAAQATPEAQALYNQLSGTASQLMPQNLDTQTAAQNYIQRQQALLAPQREQQLAGVRNSLFQRGRSGLATGATSTGMQATNPEMAAYYNALAQQDAQLAANAEQVARQNLQQDIGLSSQLGTTALGQLQQSQQQALQNALSRGQFASGLQQAGFQAGQGAQAQAFNQALSRSQFGTGLLGTAFGALNQSEQQALQNALARGQFASQQGQAALQTQQQAEELSRRRLLEGLQVGTGLFGQAANLLGQGYSLQQQSLAPFGSAFQQTAAIEQQAQQPLTIGAGLGAGSAGAAGVLAQQQNMANQLTMNRNTAIAGGLADPVSQLIGKLFGNPYKAMPTYGTSEGE